MLKKIISTILIIIWIYIMLIFLKPQTTDFIESHFWSNFSVKVRALKEVLDWKKTFSEFKEFISEDNPNIKKYFDTINSWISWVKGSVDSIRKKVLDTKDSINENIEVVENWIKKVEETKEKIDKITDILKNEEKNIKNSVKLEKLNIDKIEDKIDDQIEQDILEEEEKNTKKEKKIYYNPMWDDF